MRNQSARSIGFLHYEIDLSRRELRADGTLVEIEPQVFDLISFFVQNPGRVLTRGEISDAVWNGRFVSDAAISTKIKSARKALGDDGERQQMIRTVPRKGFLFVPEINQNDPVVDAATSHTESPALPTTALSGQRPSIVVLPFKNLSGDPGQAYFSDGITEDVITDLSRYSELTVIARHSAFAFHERAGNSLDFAAELGVAYMAEGSVRRADNRVRITVQLVDVSTAETLWAEKFHRRVEDVLDVQEEVATVIVNILAGKVQQRHYRRVLGKGERSASAYDHALRAQQHIWSFSKAGTLLARQAAQQAVELDPLLARAHATLSWAWHLQATNGWHGDLEEAFDRSLAAAREAVLADTNEPWAHNILGLSFWWSNRQPDFDRANDVIRHAIRLNPSNAHFYTHLGAMLPYMGCGDEALRQLDRAVQLNPLYPAMYLEHRSRAHFVEGRYEESLADAQRAVVQLPTLTNLLAMLAVGYEQLGQHSRAVRTIAELEAVSPDFSVGFVRRTVPYAHDRHRDKMCELLARAGLKA